MPQVHLPTVDARGFGATRRTDAWWLGPLLTFLGLSLFVVYATWAAFQNANYEYGPYLSPMYAPLFKPTWWPLSPAFLILWAPGGFRLTCYYYRKAYYRSFVLHPAACAVGEPHKGYRGETAFPLILQNLHRYFFYLAVIFIVLLVYDAVRSFFWLDGFQVHLGSLVLSLNAVLLGLYTFSCHSCRHAVGGNVNCYSRATCGMARYRVWRWVSALNANHMLFAWLSLFSVMGADLYVRLCAMHVINDPSIL